MACNIANQLEKSTNGNNREKTNIQKKLNNKQLKKIAIDPFIDAESGYPVKINHQIKDIFSQEVNKGKEFSIAGYMDSENFETSGYIMNGMITNALLENKTKAYKVYATVFEKSSGVILAADSVYVESFDSTPIDIYKDNPIHLKGKNYEALVSSIKKNPQEAVNNDYVKRLKNKAMLVKGDLLYDEKEYNKSLAYYNMASSRVRNNQDIEILSGQFTNLVKKERILEAKLVYAKLLKACIIQSNGITHKISFTPNSIDPLASKMDLYNIYFSQIAHQVAESKKSCVQIIVDSGNERAADMLPLQREKSIRNQLLSNNSKIENRLKISEPDGKEITVETGKEDSPNAIDHKIEFKFSVCKGPKPLTVDDIEYLLKNKVSCKVVAMHIKQRGIQFKLNKEIRNRLKKLKADRRVFNAIAEAEKNKL
ncbi:MAG: hypothetical protein ABFD50_18820 [Smithella sp.]